MIKSHLYIKEYSSEDWDVAHVYEHLFIRRAQRQLDKAGLPVDLVGFITGQTFRDHVIELRALFYDSTASRTFSKFMEAVEQPFSDQEIAIAVKEIENEERARASFDNAEVKRVLDRIKRLPWIRIQDFNYKDFASIKANKEPTGLIKFSETKLQSIRIDLILPKRAYGEYSIRLTVWERLSVIATDVVGHRIALHYQYGITTSQSAVRFKSMSRARVELAGSHEMGEAQLYEEVRRALDRLKNPRYFTFIHDHLVHWANDPFLQHAVGIESYFRQDEILIGGKGMKFLVTAGLINEIVDNIKIRVRVF